MISHISYFYRKVFAMLSSVELIANLNANILKFQLRSEFNDESS